MEEVSFSRTADPRYLDLIWNEFFLSRNRGLTVSAHFPWIAEQSTNVIYAQLHDGNDLSGGLVLKESSHCMRQGPKVASIGLVCVQKEFRGRGLSGVLLASTIKCAREEEFKALTLWTNKRSVYEAHGFVCEDRLLYGWVNNPEGGSGFDLFDKDFTCSSVMREAAANVPLPPFANEAVVLRNGESSCTIIRDDSGPIVADYSGDPYATALILKRVLPGRWRMNALSDDPVLGVLARAGLSAELKPVNLQMWLSLDDRYSSMELAEMGRFTVLDRI